MRVPILFSMKSGWMSQRGFTLIETAVFIIVLGMLASLLIPFTVSLRGGPTSAVTQQTISLAQGELEQTMAQKHAAGFGAVTTGQNQSCIISMPSNFSCSKNVCYVTAANPDNDNACSNPSSNYKRVQVTITNSTVGAVTAVTLLSNY